ncbi:MAG: arginine--tRNA ligase, partial [Patescibacteria group bacterium]
SETWRMGEEIVRENVGNIFEESEGAIIFDGEKYGLHKRVFITAQGLTTYEAKEIGLAMLKKDRSPSDLYVMTTAVEQEEYFKVVKKAIELIDPYFEGRLKHVPHGMMQLTSGKMSSRSGNVVTGESLIENAQEVAAKKVSERVEGDATSELIDMIAVAGIKFNILKQRVSKNIAYDPDTAISFEGDSGPYLQYTYARCKSVIEKAKEQNIKSVTDGVVCDKSQDIEKLLAQFGEVVERSSNEYASHHVANYVLELAHEYNAYYAENIIVDIKNPELSAYRVAVTVATAQVIKNALMLLGIRVPEQM